VVAAIGGAGPASGTHVLAIVDLTNPFAPRALSILPLPGTASGVHDVVLRDTTVFVGTNAGTLVVSVADPAQPRLIGIIAEVSGRLAFVGDHLLLGSVRQLAATTHASGGLRNAALRRFLYIPTVPSVLTRRVEADPDPDPDPASPSVQRVERLEDTQVRVLFFPPDDQIIESTIQIVQDNEPLTAPTPVTMAKGIGRLTLPRGTTHAAQAKVEARAIFRLGDGESLAAQRELGFGYVQLVVDRNNDSKIDQTDIDLKGDGRYTHAFWQAAPRYLDTTQRRVTNPESLLDHTTVRVRVTGKVERGKVRFVVTGTDARQWTMADRVPSSVEPALQSSDWTNRQMAILQGDCFEGDTGRLGNCARLMGEPLVLGHIMHPGTYDFLWRCERCPIDTTRQFRLENRPGLTDPALTLDQEAVDVRPLSDWLSVFSNRGVPAERPVGQFTQIAGTAPVPDEAQDVTLLVHGYNVSATDAYENFLPKYFKRLHWAGHTMLGRSATSRVAHAVGIVWPGDFGRTAYSLPTIGDPSAHSLPR